MESWSMNADETETRRHEAARWLAIAKEDARVARGCLRLEIPAPGSAAYHCQQAAEKVVKGLLVIAGAAFTRTHDMDELADVALVHYPKQKPALEAVRRLTFWGIAYRYPGPEDVPEPLPSEEDIERTISNIEALAANN
jgi:HEPN domain-containing protein